VVIIFLRALNKSAEPEPVIDYIKEHCNGQVFALCGLSLGAQIVVEESDKTSRLS